MNILGTRGGSRGSVYPSVEGLPSAHLFEIWSSRGGARHHLRAHKTNARVMRGAAPRRLADEDLMGQVGDCRILSARLIGATIGHQVSSATSPAAAIRKRSTG
jgi:hypothetical protein